jgi:arylsulfatase
LLTGQADAVNPHDAYWFYYENNQLQAVTSGDGEWKLQLPHGYRTLDGRPGGKNGQPADYVQKMLTAPELYRLADDPGESRDVAAAHPQIVAKLLESAERARAELGDSLTGRKGAGTRAAGRR